MSSKKLSMVLSLFVFFFQPFDIFAANLERDPTRPNNQLNVVAKKTEKSPFSVTAILSKGNRFLAIVNRQSVSVGDEVDGWLVTDIQKDYVQMRLKDSSEQGSSIKFRVSERVNVKN